MYNNLVLRYYSIHITNTRDFVQMCSFRNKTYITNFIWEYEFYYALHFSS